MEPLRSLQRTCKIILVLQVNKKNVCGFCKHGDEKEAVEICGQLWSNRLVDGRVCSAHHKCMVSMIYTAHVLIFALVLGDWLVFITNSRFLLLLLL